MTSAPQGMRCHVTLFGRRNVGKSSLLNALARQTVAIVSPEPGCTTDPVRKAMELQPLGPVLLTDTAGLDDDSDLGAARVAATHKAMAHTDVALVVTDGGRWDAVERDVVARLVERDVATVAVFNKCDVAVPATALADELRAAGVTVVLTSAVAETGMPLLRQAIVDCAPERFFAPPAIAADLVPAGGLAVLVVPIDLEAPAGRLILPQVQTIRDLLDHDAACLVVKERELRPMLERLRQPPDLVVTDSQAFLKVAADTPCDVPLTSFSVLFARLKGDLATFADGARAIERLRPGDRVLVAEACTHHPRGEDIGRVKIPRWLTQYVGGKLEFDTVQGKDFPADLDAYRLVIHCGACTMNRRGVVSRVAACRAAGVPVTNYGLTIAYVQGLFERAMAPFEGAKCTGAPKK